MNVLFLSVYEINNSDSGYIYADLVREFAEHGHNVYAVTPTRSERTGIFTDANNAKIIKVKNGQIQKTGRIKKVLNLLSLERKTIKAVKKYARGIKFDLIVNMSSNISYQKTAAYFKKRHGAVNYLLQKDIFPQNAVDIGMMKTTGLMGMVYRHFCKKEKKMYRRADFIGCMSMANKEYICKHNPELPPEKVTIVPNSIRPQDMKLSDDERAAMRRKYGIPQDKKVFVYGGNLGKPQDIPFIIQCLEAEKDNENVFFFIVGDGTEYGKLESYAKENPSENVKVLRRLPREDFDAMLAACDVGLIFLDRRFTVPNYPSRLLSYMQAGLPVVACTDSNTDVGRDIAENGFGWRCESGDTVAFTEIIKECESADLAAMGQLAFGFLSEKFSTAVCYDTITAAVQK